MAILRYGSPVLGNCQQVGNLRIAALTQSSSAALELNPVAPPVMIRGKLLLTSRRTDYFDNGFGQPVDSDPGSGGTTPCEDFHTFDQPPASPLRLALLGPAPAAIVWGECAFHGRNGGTALPGSFTTKTVTAALGPQSWFPDPLAGYEWRLLFSGIKDSGYIPNGSDTIFLIGDILFSTAAEPTFTEVLSGTVDVDGNFLGIPATYPYSMIDAYTEDPSGGLPAHHQLISSVYILQIGQGGTWCDPFLSPGACSGPSPCVPV